MPTALEDWAGRFLVEDEIVHSTADFGEAPDPVEFSRASRRSALAMERLTNDRARSYAELSAKLAVAADLLRSGCSELAQQLLGAVMIDLRLLEAEAALAETESDATTA